jgi:hypothetical protein
VLGLPPDHPALGGTPEERAATRRKAFAIIEGTDPELSTNQRGDFSEQDFLQDVFDQLPGFEDILSGAATDRLAGLQEKRGISAAGRAGDRALLAANARGVGLPSGILAAQAERDALSELAGSQLRIREEGEGRRQQLVGGLGQGFLELFGNIFQERERGDRQRQLEMLRQLMETSRRREFG